MKTEAGKKALLFGFAALFLCGIGDWLIGYDPPGGEPLLFGISNTAIAGLPTWLYILSLFLGILSGFGCRAFAPAMLEVLDAIGVPKASKAHRAFRFGLASAPMMFVSFHAACIVLLLMQAALRAGLDVHAANGVFLLPAASLLPFVVWCFLCDIPVTAAYAVFVLKGRLKLPKAAAVCCPLGMSLLAKAVGAILLAANSKLAFLTFALHDIFSKARYGDMQAFVAKLREMGYERVELIDTTRGMFMSPRVAGWMALSGSALLTGRK